MSDTLLLFDLENLHKKYDRFEALKGITLKMEEGSIGLLGPNGAGKSTLIKTLLGLLPFTGGSASVLGHRLPDEKMKILRKIGYMPENDCYLPDMTAIQYVSFGGRLTGMPASEAFRRAHEVLFYVGLNEARYRKLGGFSTGMKQRVKLAQALVHGPELVFLDEPTNGLDPNGRDEMLQLIQDIKSRGVNVVLSSHLLQDVEQVCDTIIMMNHGELLFSGHINDLKKDGENTIEIDTKNQNDAFEALLKEKGLTVKKDGFHLKVYLAKDQNTQDILQMAIDADIQIRHFMPGQLTLEAAFLGILNQQKAAT